MKFVFDYILLRIVVSNLKERIVTYVVITKRTLHKFENKSFIKII